MKPIITSVFLALIGFLFAHVLPASAAEPAPSITESSALNSLLNSSDISLLQQELTQSDKLSDDDKKGLELELEKASQWIADSHKYRQELTLLHHSVTHAKQRLADLKASQKQLEKVDSQSAPEAFLESTPANLDASLNQAEKTLEKANQDLLRLDKVLGQYLLLATDGAQQIVELKRTLNQLQESVKAKQIENAQSLESRIQLMLLQARQQLLEQNLKRLNYQIDNMSILTELAQTERDYLSTRKVGLLDKVEKLQAALQSDKAKQAAEDLKQAMGTSLSKNDPLYELQQKTIQIQQEKADLIDYEKQVDRKTNASNEAIATLKTHFERDKQIVELQGSRETIAQVLHKRLETISSVSVSDSEALKIKDRINHAVLNQLLLNENLREFAQQNDAEIVQALLDESENSVISEELAALQARAKMLHETYLTAAKELQNLYPNYISKLSELNSVYTQLQDQTDSYTRFLNEHLLWLPNVGVSGLFSAQALTQSLEWFLSGKNLTALAHDTSKVLNTQQPYIIIWLLLLGLLTYFRGRYINGLKRVAEKVRSIRTDSFLYSLQATAYTLGLSMLFPFILLGMAVLFTQIDSSSDYTQNLTKGLIDAGILVFVLSTLNQICREHGLAEHHFHWRASVRQSIQRELRWAIPFGAIMVLLIDLNTDSSSPADRQMLGRFAFIALMAGLALLFYRLWSPRSEIMRDFKSLPQSKAWLQLHFLWFPLMLALPLFLIWTTVYGYFYTALVIAERFNWTLGLILLVYVLRELLLRSLYLSERKLEYAERLKKRQALQEQRIQSKEESANSAELPSIEEPEMDYSKLSNQVRQALNLAYLLALLFGVWFLWRDVLPALNLISDSTLSLTKSQLVDGVMQQVPLTLGDLVLGVALGALTLLLSKDLPGLLEFTLLKHLPISGAARYAITSLTQYVIVIIGFVMIFRALGIEWSNIQWLVAALSVGLGFGLQEIVANFVSGVILLFEQPMRVGDIVTVDGVSGKVSKIRIRATTIVNWDRQELVIPNKQIITGQFINWSLTDQVIRVKIDVGIAYGSDVELALKLIKQAADEHPGVLKDPEPSVIFEQFGDNALNLTLRVFVEDLDNHLVIRSELNSLINDKLNQAGIVIAFPQRDVHLDASKPLEIRLSKADSKPSPTQQSPNPAD